MPHNKYDTQFFESESESESTTTVDPIKLRTYGCCGLRLKNDHQVASPLAQEREVGLQRLLAKLGFYHGRVDNMHGPKTQAAVRKFQVRNTQR